MKSKIITLAVAFVLGVTSIAFSVRPAGVPSGKGSGKNTEIEKPEELAQIILSLPSADEYYTMALKSVADKNAKSAAVAADGVVADIRPVSVYDEYSRKSSDSKSYTYKTADRVSAYETYSGTEMQQTQKAAVYFTAEAVYYNVKISNTQREEKREKYYIDFGEHKQGESSKTVTTVITETDAEFYLGVKGAFLKYNKFTVNSETLNYENDKLVENDEEENDEYDAEKVAFDAISDNLGKWINVLYFSDYSLDTEPDNIENMDEEAIINAMTQATCAQLSSMLVANFKSSIDTDCASLKKIAGIAALAENKSNSYYEKTEDFYVMTPLGRYTMLTEFGYKPTNITNNDYNSLYPVRDSSLVLDLTDGAKPAWYLDFNFSNNSGSSDSMVSYSTYTYDSLHEDLYLTNIDNTVVPAVKAKKSLYDFIGKQIKEFITKEAEGK